MTRDSKEIAETRVSGSIRIDKLVDRASNPKASRVCHDVKCTRCNDKREKDYNDNIQKK